MLILIYDALQQGCWYSAAAQGADDRRAHQEEVAGRAEDCDEC